MEVLLRNYALIGALLGGLIALLNGRAPADQDLGYILLGGVIAGAIVGALVGRLRRA